MNHEDNINTFLVYVCKHVDGIGATIAGHIASDFDRDLLAFLRADESRFMAIKRSNGKSILSQTKAHGILREKQDIAYAQDLPEAAILYLGRKFLEYQVDHIKSRTLDSIDINPLLSLALNLQTPRDVITFNVYQTITRSIVTSWGSTVEKIAQFVGARENDYTGRAGSRFDLVKTSQGTDYYIQLKSGPNTMNVQMVNALNDAIGKIEADKPDAIAILGMTYGRKNRISSQISGNIDNPDVRIKIGREFWDFVSDETDFHLKLFERLDLATESVLGAGFVEIIQAKIDEFETAWHKRYSGMTLHEALEDYI